MYSSFSVRICGGVPSTLKTTSQTRSVLESACRRVRARSWYMDPIPGLTVITSCRRSESAPLQSILSTKVPSSAKHLPFAHKRLTRTSPYSTFLWYRVLLLYHVCIGFSRRASGQGNRCQSLSKEWW